MNSTKIQNGKTQLPKYRIYFNFLFTDLTRLIQNIKHATFSLELTVFFLLKINWSYIISLNYNFFELSHQIKCDFDLNVPII